MVKSARLEKPKVLNPAPKPGHNGLLTQEVFLIHKGRIMKAAAQVAAIKKIEKAARRDAQDAGVVLKDLDENIAMSEHEPETVKDTIKRKAQYASWSNLAPPMQADLFMEDMKLDELKAAENEGYREGLEGETAKGDRYDTTNPIGRARMKGWEKGQGVLHKHLTEISEARKAKTKDEKLKAKAKADKAKPAKTEDEDLGDIPPGLDRRPGAMN